MHPIIRRRAASLSLPGLFLLLAACAGGQAPRANCFSFAEQAPEVTVSTMGAGVSRSATPCEFTTLGAVE